MRWAGGVFVKILEKEKKLDTSLPLCYLNGMMIAAVLNRLSLAQKLAFATVAISACLVKAAFGFTLPITEFTLANGLQVIVIEDHRAPVVLHAIGYRVGGADEVPGKTGLAHFFEHLMFKGTTKYPKNSFDRLMDENGAERNAFTMQDVTVFHERADVKLLNLLMDLEADRMQNLVLTDSVFETERKVVQEERRQQTESNPFAVAIEKLDATLFKVHPYGRPVVGLPADVASLTRADADAFYRSHYMPGNAIVMVVGDVRPDEVRKLAEQYYGPLKNPVALPQRQRPTEPLRASAERLELQDGRINDPLLIRKYMVPARTALAPRQAAALEVLSVILGGNSESRLERQLVVGSREAAAADASYNGMGIAYGTYQIFAMPTAGGDVLKLEQRVDNILQDIVKNGVTEDELTWAKNSTLANYIYALDNPTGFAMMIGLAIALGEERRNIFNEDAEISAVSREDVQKAAALVFQSQQHTTLLLRPKS